MIRFFERNSTKLTISEFYENYNSGKYNFNAKYQRRSNVWNEDKKSFLIDSILKNYPIPPIFLRPNVDNATGKTVYDVVDGKQRLETVIAFIENRIPLTAYFAEDVLITRSKDNSSSSNDIDERIAGLKFDEIKNNMDIFSSYIKQFWTYPFSIEYFYEDNEELIANVFDRLNRNGVPLLFQELRNAKYNNSDLLAKIKNLSANDFWNDKLQKLDDTRMEDQEFLSELFFLAGENKLFDSSPSVLDSLYEKYVNGEKKNEIDSTIGKFYRITNYIRSMNLDFEVLKKLTWPTHLYGLFSLAWHCEMNNIPTEKVKDKAALLYLNYFSRINPDSTSSAMRKYKDSCSSRTRSEGQRKNRLEAILEYCGLLP